MKREIEVLLLKLADGSRLLRLSDSLSGVSLEKQLALTESVSKQKNRWLKAFEAMLDRELGPAK